MTALIIISSILAVIAFLLFFSVNLYIDYKEDEFKVWARYLFIKIPIYPRKEKKQKSKKTEAKKPERAETQDKQPKEKKENFFTSTIKAEGIGAIVEILSKIIEIVKDFSSSTLKHLKVKKLKLDVISAGENAADAALNFGYACSTIYPALGALSGLISFLKIPDVNITVDYDKKETLASLVLQFKMKLFFLLAVVLKYGIKGILLYIDLTNTDTKENELLAKKKKAVKN